MTKKRATKKKATKKRSTRKKATKKPTTQKSSPPAKAEGPDPAKVNQVLKWILTGANEFELEEAIASHWPDQDRRPLIVQAMQTAAASADADPQLVKAWAFEATRHVYQQAMSANDFGAALRALKMIGDYAR